MALLELMVQLKSKGVKISLKPNYKKYYNVFPHVIRFNSNSEKEWNEIREINHATIKSLHDKILETEFKSRSEYFSLNVYCQDLNTVMSAIPVSLLKKWKTIELGQMAEEVFEESKIKPELPRAQTTVVKKLPFDQWRYRVHWPTNYRTIKKIGNDALSSIIDQINNDPNSKTFDNKTTEKLKRGTWWGASYFYTNSEDILCLISLINPLFIKKIEKFTTLEELNEKTTS